jgi:hypothetical protein
MYYREYNESDFITSEDVLSAKKEIRGYKVEPDRMSGAIYWYKENEDDYMLYATPSWNDQWGVVPFDGIDGDYLGKLDFTKSEKYLGNLPLQLELYFEAIETCIERLESKKTKTLTKL